MSFVVGLTGGIGSGKTAVADAFAALDVELIDTDLIAHRLSTAGRPGYHAILAAFGNSVLQSDGELDRAALRRIVFADAEARARLEGILHPLIADEVASRVECWGGAYGIIVVPLLLERAGLRSLADRVLVVDCPEAEQIRRVVARSGLSSAEVRAIMAAQIGRAQRLAAADDVLHNVGTPDAIAPQVAALDRLYRQLAADKAAST